jgi:hypothetical protein
MTASRRASFLLLLTLGSCFYSCGDSTDVEWNGFVLRPIESPTDEVEWRSAPFTLAYELIQDEPLLFFQDLEDWCYDQIDFWSRETLGIRVKTEHGPIWLVWPMISLHASAASHMINGTPGQDPLRFSLERGNFANLLCTKTPFANNDWQPLEIGRLAHPQIGMVFHLRDGFTFGHAKYMMELAADAGAPAVSFYKYWVTDDVAESPRNF